MNWIRLIPGPAKTALKRWMLRLGWRPSDVVPIDPLYIEEGRFGFDEEELIKPAARAVSSHTVLSYERLATLWHQVRYLDKHGIPGDLVECGVFRGGAVGMMALAHLASSRKPTRILHLFDSFEGLPEPRAEVDGQIVVREVGGRASGVLKSLGMAVAGPEIVRDLLEQRIGYEQDLTCYHVGWFQETLPRDAPAMGQIALLRLDGDWYDSTKVCLDHLAKKVSSGGVIVIDDYGYYEGCRRAVDEFLATQDAPIMLHRIDSTGRYWLVP